MWRSVILSALLWPALAHASTKEKALQEIKTQGSPSESATEVDVSKSGYLTLEDPGLSDIRSPWHWLLAFRLQTLSPQGSLEMRNGEIFELSDVTPFWAPSIEVGTTYQLSPRPSGLWQFGGSMDLTSWGQKTSVTFPGGQEAENSRLTMSILSATVFAIWRSEVDSKFEGMAGLSDGAVTTSHSADNDGANFSDSARSWAVRLGASYRLSDRWSLGLEQTQRTFRGKDGVSLPSGITSLQARILW